MRFVADGPLPHPLPSAFVVGVCGWIKDFRCPPTCETGSPRYSDNTFAARRASESSLCTVWCHALLPPGQSGRIIAPGALPAGQVRLKQSAKHWPASLGWAGSSTSRCLIHCDLRHGDSAIDARDGRNQRLGVGVLRSRDYVRGGPLLDHLATVQYRDPVRKVGGR